MLSYINENFQKKCEDLISFIVGYVPLENLSYVIVE